MWGSDAPRGGRFRAAADGAAKAVGAAYGTEFVAHGTEFAAHGAEFAAHEAEFAAHEAEFAAHGAEFGLHGAESTAHGGRVRWMARALRGADNKAPVRATSFRLAGFLRGFAALRLCVSPA
jgi:hypothetical protein